MLRLAVCALAAPVPCSPQAAHPMRLNCVAHARESVLLCARCWNQTVHPAVNTWDELKPWCRTGRQHGMGAR